jgi:PAS domain S-box-containing protein
LRINSDNQAHSLSIDIDDNGQITPSDAQAHPLALKISPRHAVLGIGVAAVVAGIVETMTAAHPSASLTLLSVGSSIAGAVVIASFVLKASIPSFERLIEAHRERANRAEEQYRAIFDNSVEGIFQTTPDGRYLKANPKLAEIYGYSSPAQMIASLTNISAQLYVEPGKREEFIRMLEENDKVLGFESQVRKRTGEIIWIRENARAIRDENGALSSFEGTVLDISLRKRAESEVQNSRLQERTNASNIQQTLLLGKPPEDLPWLKISAYTLPSHAIDGDFFDFYQHDDTTFDVLVGDVMGKGVAAALLGASIKSSYLRAIGKLLYVNPAHQLPSPEQIVERMHQKLTAQFIQLETFATLCCLRFDKSNGMLTYVDCGHTKTLHCASNGALFKLESECVPLGFSIREQYVQHKINYSPGDIFLCYSDGVTEAANSAGEQFGCERLEQLVIEGRSASPASLINTIRQAVLDHCDGVPLGDDLTVVAIAAK